MSEFTVTIYPSNREFIVTADDLAGAEKAAFAKTRAKVSSIVENTIDDPSFVFYNIKIPFNETRLEVMERLTFEHRRLSQDRAITRAEAEQLRWEALQERRNADLDQEYQDEHRAIERLGCLTPEEQALQDRCDAAMERCGDLFYKDVN